VIEFRSRPRAPRRPTARGSAAANEIRRHVGRHRWHRGELQRTRSTAFRSNSPTTLIADVPLSFTLQGRLGRARRSAGELARVHGRACATTRHSELQDNVSPRAALFFSQERYGAKLLYAEGFRNPSAFEGYFKDGLGLHRPPRGSDGRADSQLRGGSRGHGRCPAWRRGCRHFGGTRATSSEAGPAPEDRRLLQFQNVARYVSLASRPRRRIATAKAGSCSPAARTRRSAAR